MLLRGRWQDCEQGERRFGIRDRETEADAAVAWRGFVPPPANPGRSRNGTGAVQGPRRRHRHRPKIGGSGRRQVVMEHTWLAARTQRQHLLPDGRLIGSLAVPVTRFASVEALGEHSPTTRHQGATWYETAVGHRDPEARRSRLLRSGHQKLLRRRESRRGTETYALGLEGQCQACGFASARRWTRFDLYQHRSADFELFQPRL